jgi:hypothetical protein
MADEGANIAHFKPFRTRLLLALLYFPVKVSDYVPDTGRWFII